MKTLKSILGGAAIGAIVGMILAFAFTFSSTGTSASELYFFIAPFTVAFGALVGGARGAAVKENQDSKSQ